ncbi:hypothetical protein INT48_009317 [Thamnidium elegans]|uniref:Zn(2)-C6 fungal-type domain-containing protein n=1 Tax=Thamnidium elegans TaxID=101142 RepID=A0A8H7VRR3_9FUNG|nr:hypothetical protein INT48_009317 [Thamnidium elegans]
MPKIAVQPTTKRVKVTLACIICRKKKVKCDGIQPSCSRCQSIGNCCEYSEPPKKRGPPKGYVEVIENRAHRIESLLGKQQQQMIIKRDDYKPLNPLLYLVSNLVEHGSHGIVYDFLMKETARKQDNLWTDNFFNHFNFIFPILSRPQFILEFENDELNPLLNLAVLLLGCRLENDDNYLEQEKILYQQFFLSLDLLSITDLTTIQAIVIMCWYTYIAGDMVKCHSLRHQLAQLILDLNFTFESDDIHFNEMKRRTYWVSFVIDQLISSCTGTKKLITNQYLFKWPQLEDDQLYLNQQATLQINSFHQLIMLSIIMANISNSHNINNLESNLTEWLLQLPSHLDYGRLTPIAKLYRILYYTVQIMINNNTNGLNSNSICTNAANTIIHISEQMIDLGQQKYLHNLFFSSLTLATSIHIDKQDKPSLYKSISVIKKLNSSLLSCIHFNLIMDQLLIDDTCQSSSSPSQLPFDLFANQYYCIDTFDNQTIESSTTTCSPASYITPTHSPSSCLKEEDISFSFISDQHFFSLL